MTGHRKNVAGGCKTIPLSQGKCALVDLGDYHRLAKHKWYAAKRRNTWYAVRNVHRNGKHTLVYMHIYLTGRRGTDHRDGDGLNNQRYNLRSATNRQNTQNRRGVLGTSSRYKGVHWYKSRCKWAAYITACGRHISLGYFEREEDAAQAYDAAALKYFGEFARPNLGMAKEET